MRLAVNKTKPFARFARLARIDDTALWKAAERANWGLIDADLGSGVIKQRIARSGEGKSGGSRTIVLFRLGERAVFVHGFAEKEPGNIWQNELEAFRELATVILGYSEEEMAQRVAEGALLAIESPKEG
jgi:hypothetical protein